VPTATATSSSVPTATATSSSVPKATATPSSLVAEGEGNVADPEVGGGVPSWVWWLLAALVLLGVVLAALLVPRTRRRRAWDADMATAQDRVAWFARDLLPALQELGSPAAVAGGWQVARARVTEAEDRLTALASSDPDVGRQGRALSLRDAVRAARESVETELASGDPDTLRHGLSEVAAQLSAALDLDRAGR
jgi:hypothetical protein